MPTICRTTTLKNNVRLIFKMLGSRCKEEPRKNNLGAGRDSGMSRASGASICDTMSVRSRECS